MPFRKDKLHQRQVVRPLKSSFELKTSPLWSWSAFKRSHFPLNSEVRKTQVSLCHPVMCKSQYSVGVGASPLRGVHAKSWPNMHVLDCHQFPQLCVMLRIGRRSLFLATALQPALSQSPSPAQTQAPTQSPRQQDCQSACGGHSCLFSESHGGGGFNIFASGTTLIDGSLKLCTKLYRSGKLSSIVTWRDRKLKKTADVGMHEERSECSLVFSINFDLCDLLPTFLSFSSVSSIYA